MSKKNKTGRKQKHFVTADSETIVGLSRRSSDGRWRVIGTQQTFTEADERAAVLKFYELADSKPPYRSGRPSDENRSIVACELQPEAEVHFPASQNRPNPFKTPYKRPIFAH